MYIAQTPQNCPDFKGVDGDWTPHNVGVTPHFFIDRIKRKDADGNEAEIEVECVTLVVAGDTLTEASMPVDDQLRERFADQYAAWKDGKECIVGTPVSEWKAISARQAMFLEANNIFTVESLAALTDGNIHNVTDGRELRDKAVRWLRAMASASKAEENAKLRAEIAELKKWKAEVQAKNSKRRTMTQAQKDKVSATMKARWARVPTDAASVTDKSENQVSGEKVLPAV
jgi:hypothetical protein